MRQTRRGRRRAGAFAALLWLPGLMLSGCAALPPGPASADADAACRWLFAEADRAVAAAGVGDAGAARMAGFAWLRIDRPLASFRDELTTPEAWAAWLARLAALDAQARGFELQNLDARARARLQERWAAAAPGQPLPADPAAAMTACRSSLNAEMAADPAARAALREAATVPDAYRRWQRMLGLYPLSAAIVRPRVTALHRHLAAEFGAGLPEGAPLRRHAGRVPEGATPQAAAAWLAGLPRDALGIPLIDAAGRALLLAAHAPVWEIETLSAADRPGALLLDSRARPFAAGWHPVEYRELGWTRLGDQVLVQLSYSLWFAERPPSGPLDIYAGHLDSVVWRVTLDAQGGVLAYDSMHGCGCYYMLFPGPGWRLAPQPRGAEPVLVPAPAPIPAGAGRVLLSLRGGSHYLTGAAPVSRSTAARELIALDGDELRSLPRAVRGRASVFAPDGLVPSSRRPERFLLWPLGVPSAGAQRQPGTHAIAFIGRRHFDDARLLEALLEPAP